MCIFAIPVPVALFWHSSLGRGYGLMLFLVACMFAVACAVERTVASIERDATPLAADAAKSFWRRQTCSLAAGLLLPYLAFSTACILVSNQNYDGMPKEIAAQGIWRPVLSFETTRDFVAPILALFAVVAAITVVPYFTLTTRSPFAAATFSAALVGCMKFAGALVVVFVYGWGAAEKGHTTMPWKDPNLLVWLFLGFSSVLCVACYFLGRSRFMRFATGRASTAIFGEPRGMAVGPLPRA